MHRSPEWVGSVTWIEILALHGWFKVASPGEDWVEETEYLPRRGVMTLSLTEEVVMKKPYHSSQLHFAASHSGAGYFSMHGGNPIRSFSGSLSV